MFKYSCNLVLCFCDWNATGFGLQKILYQNLYKTLNFLFFSFANKKMVKIFPMSVYCICFAFKLHLTKILID